MEKTNKVSGFIALASLVLAIVWSDMAPIFLLILVVSGCVWLITELGVEESPTFKAVKTGKVNIWKVLIWIGVIGVAVHLIRHWGFFGIIVFTIVYGLWAVNTEDKSKTTKK